MLRKRRPHAMTAAPQILRARNRANWLGGTDVPKVLGVSPYGTATTCWLEKTGQAAPELPDAERDQVRRRGRMLEPYVRAMTIHKLRAAGHDVQLTATNRRYRDAEMPFMAAEIDFELVLDGQPVNAEIKTATGFLRHAWGAEETDEIPDHYTAQVLHGMGVTQRRSCIVGALVGLGDVGIYRVERDDELLATMRATCGEFWTQCVQPRRRPDPMRFSDVKALWPKDNARTVEATSEVADFVRDLRRASAAEKLAKVQAESLRMHIGAYMRDAAQLTIEGRPAVTFRTHEQRTLDVEALRRDHPDWAALYEREAEVRAMRIPNSFRG